MICDRRNSFIRIYYIFTSYLFTIMSIVLRRIFRSEGAIKNRQLLSISIPTFRMQELLFKRSTESALKPDRKMPVEKFLQIQFSSILLLSTR